MARDSLPDLFELLEFTKETASRAAEQIARYYATSVPLQYKQDDSPVTPADEASESLIRAAITHRFPTHKIVSEESADSLCNIGTAGSLWVVDPLDGTLNLLHRRSQFAVAIAYAYNGVVQLGVVCNPIEDETFSAIKGKGAWRNGAEIQVSGRSDIKRALIGTGFPHDRTNIEPVLSKLRAIILNCQDIRRLGSPALDICWVADGRLDGFYETLFPWDVAAACLIAQEAGARSGHLNEVPKPIPVDLYGEDVVVATPAIYDALVAVLRGARV